MQTAIRGNGIKTSKEEISSDDICGNIHDDCDKCAKGSFMMLLEKMWNYKMPLRWIFFFFVIQTVLGIFVTKYFLVRYIMVS